MKPFALIAVFAAAGLASGCGGPAQPAADLPEQSVAVTPSAPVPTTPSSTPSTVTNGQPVPGTLVVRQHGTQPARTLWYLRVESPAAKPLVQRSYPGTAIAQTAHFKAGDYRVIAYSRPCSGTCSVHGEDGLGPLAEVCGIKVHLAADTRTAVTVAMKPDGSCGFQRA